MKPVILNMIPEEKNCFYYYDNDNREIALSRSDLTTNNTKLLCRIVGAEPEVLKKVSVHSVPVPYISPSADGKTLTFKYDYKKTKDPLADVELVPATEARLK